MTPHIQGMVEELGKKICKEHLSPSTPEEAVGISAESVYTILQEIMDSLSTIVDGKMEEVIKSGEDALLRRAVDPERIWEGI